MGNPFKRRKAKHQYPLTKPTSKDSANLKKQYAETVKKIASQLEIQNHPSIRESEDTGISRSDLKDQTQIEPEEAFATVQLAKASDDDDTKIVNQYKNVESTDIGHNISSSDNPELFEVEFEDTGKGSFEKLCAVTCIFQELNIRRSNSNNKHVILHFDTISNGIPELLTAAFQHLKIKDQVTSK